ncbi:hypothetical protein K443DRAFT_56712, partial [Laccaria amethystina LaAM-08-1]
DPIRLETIRTIMKKITYTNMDGRAAPGTARTCFCNPQWLIYPLLHSNWRWKISSLCCSQPCSRQIQCTSGCIPH